MHFEVIPNNGRAPKEGRDAAYLWTDNWNDWFKYRTLYYLTYFDEAGNPHEIGSVKIGQFAMAKDQDRPDLPSSFEALDERFFSLGQDVEYYTAVMALGGESGHKLLSSLNDIAANEALYRRALSEDVTGISLLRVVNMKTIENQYRRILTGGVELTSYIFRYVRALSKGHGIETFGLDFEVTPSSLPPTNIHVLIGRNGVGKTSLLNAMARSLVSSDGDQRADGYFISQSDAGEETHESPFTNILSISFSAFDDFEIVMNKRNATAGVRYTNVGLRKRLKSKKDAWVTITRDPEDLAKEFSDSAKLCSRGGKSARWCRALTMLQSDPLFAEAEVASLANADELSFGREAGKLYRLLSSGHKIVLLTIAKLVEHVEEKTLVLMDEPEAHLHPPLLSAFIRALSDLLINRNGVAIIATHSPVILQEVPRSCVWKIIRHGTAVKAARPSIETFAENIGILTNEIFGLEVTRSGFHRMLLDASADQKAIQDVVRKFDGQVGSEGRALISSLMAQPEITEEL